MRISQTIRAAGEMPGASRWEGNRDFGFRDGEVVVDDDDGGIIWFRIDFFNMSLGFSASSSIWVQRKEGKIDKPK